MIISPRTAQAAAFRVNLWHAASLQKEQWAWKWPPALVWIGLDTIWINCSALWGRIQIETTLWTVMECPSPYRGLLLSAVFCLYKYNESYVMKCRVFRWTLCPNAISYFLQNIFPKIVVKVPNQKHSICHYSSKYVKWTVSRDWGSWRWREWLKHYKEMNLLQF
jgi:hypothetical protein